MKIQDFNIYKDAESVLEFDLGSLSAESFNSLVFVWRLSKTSRHSSIFEKTKDSGIFFDGGKVKVSVTPSDVADLSEDAYHYDLRVFDVSGRVTKSVGKAYLKRSAQDRYFDRMKYLIPKKKTVFNMFRGNYRQLEVEVASVDTQNKFNNLVFTWELSKSERHTPFIVTSDIHYNKKIIVTLNASETRNIKDDIYYYKLIGRDFSGNVVVEDIGSVYIHDSIVGRHRLWYLLSSFFAKPRFGGTGFRVTPATGWMFTYSHYLGIGAIVRKLRAVLQSVTAFRSSPLVILRAVSEYITSTGVDGLGNLTAMISSSLTAGVNLVVKPMSILRGRAGLISHFFIGAVGSVIRKIPSNISSLTNLWGIGEVVSPLKGVLGLYTNFVSNGFRILEVIADYRVDFTFKVGVVVTHVSSMAYRIDSLLRAVSIMIFNVRGLLFFGSVLSAGATVVRDIEVRLIAYMMMAVTPIQIIPVKVLMYSSTFIDAVGSVIRKIPSNLQMRERLEGVGMLIGVMRAGLSYDSVLRAISNMTMMVTAYYRFKSSVRGVLQSIYHLVSNVLVSSFLEGIGHITRILKSFLSMYSSFKGKIVVAIPLILDFVSSSSFGGVGNLTRIISSRMVTSFKFHVGAVKINIIDPVYMISVTAVNGVGSIIRKIPSIYKSAFSLIADPILIRKIRSSIREYTQLMADNNITRIISSVISDTTNFLADSQRVVWGYNKYFVRTAFINTVKVVFSIVVTLYESTYLRVRGEVVKLVSALYKTSSSFKGSIYRVLLGFVKFYMVSSLQAVTVIIHIAGKEAFKSFNQLWVDAQRVIVIVLDYVVKTSLQAKVTVIRKISATFDTLTNLKADYILLYSGIGRYLFVTSVKAVGSVIRKIPSLLSMRTVLVAWGSIIRFVVSEFSSVTVLRVRGILILGAVSDFVSTTLLRVRSVDVSFLRSAYIAISSFRGINVLVRKIGGAYLLFSSMVGSSQRVVWSYIAYRSTTSFKVDGSIVYIISSSLRSFTYLTLTAVRVLFEGAKYFSISNLGGIGSIIRKIPAIFKETAELSGVGHLIRMMVGYFKGNTQFVATAKLTRMVVGLYLTVSLLTSTAVRVLEAVGKSVTTTVLEGYMTVTYMIKAGYISYSSFKADMIAIFNINGGYIITSSLKASHLIIGMLKSTLRERTYLNVSPVTVINQDALLSFMSKVMGVGQVIRKLKYSFSVYTSLLADSSYIANLRVRFLFVSAFVVKAVRVISANIILFNSSNLEGWGSVVRKLSSTLFISSLFYVRGVVVIFSSSLMKVRSGIEGFIERVVSGVGIYRTVTSVLGEGGLIRLLSSSFRSFSLLYVDVVMVVFSSADYYIITTLDGIGSVVRKIPSLYKSFSALVGIGNMVRFLASQISCSSLFRSVGVIVRTLSSIYKSSSLFSGIITVILFINSNIVSMSSIKALGSLIVKSSSDCIARSSFVANAVVVSGGITYNSWGYNKVTYNTDQGIR